VIHGNASRTGGALQKTETRMPAGRAIWKGHLRLSLISVPVAVHNAVSSSERISFNQLHKDCNLRLKQQMVCPKHGNIERSEIVKGFEYDKDQYILVGEDDLERLKQATSKTIEITQFVNESELDPMYIDAPYYIVPDGPIGEQAYRVLQEALAKTRKIGIGQFVMSQRAHIVALRAHDKGMLMTTLRSQDEVRRSEEYFTGLGSGEVSKSEMKLATDLIDNFTETLDTSAIKDKYQEGLKALINAKLAGKQPEIVEEPEFAGTMNFMSALEESLKAAKKRATTATKKKPMAKSVKPAKAIERKRKKA
jgi:DNA end-binding protein Ku